MKKKTVWLAFGLVAVMCATSLAGAMTLTDIHTAEASAAEEAEEAAIETELIEAAETDTTESAQTETDAAAIETEAQETETETETESETETETEYEPELVAVAYEQEGAWGNVAITNSEKVETGVNIRYAADTESEILGYLYRGTAVWVIEKGDVWTQFYSNGITGYVMTDYLLFGDDVAEIAEVYGAEGVRADWDDVNIYTDMEGSTVKDTMEAEDVYQVVNDYGHWIEIQYDEDSTAFVSSEDVTSVMLFESATPKDQERVELVKLYDIVWPEETTVSEDQTSEASSDSSSTGSSSTGSSSSTSSSSTGSSSTGSSSSGSSSTGSSSSGSSSTGSSSTGSSSTGSSSSSSSSGSSSSSSSSSTSETTAATEAETTAATEAETTAATEAETTAQTETTASTESTSSTESSSSSTDDDDDEDDDMGYYDADTDTYYDSNGNVVTSSLDEETAVAAVSETEAAIFTASETEAEITAATEAETTASTEAESTVSTEAAAATASVTSDSTDNTTLLAALIYCEAGNQSYDGMVAVGAVVMNRVASSSFPNTISEVIYQSGQFTPASSGALSTAIANGVPSTCYTAAQAAIAGEDPTGGALYFNTTANKGIQIGDHWFY